MAQSTSVLTGCLDYNAFAALLDGALPRPEQQVALRHIARCRECRAMAADLGYELPPDPALAATDVSEDRNGAPPRADSEDRNPALAGTAAAPDGQDPVPALAVARGESACVSIREDAAPLIGRVIAGYRIKREIGHGGMGAVYEAVHERMGQRAAVKVMFPQFSQDAAFIRRFRTEAKAASVVRHPGLVTIFNYGQFPDETAYIMMEYLDGQTLRSRIGARRMSVHEALRMGRQIASALCAVHQHGIVHRDLKPDNIVIVPDADLPGGERAKILDFGIAKHEANPSTAGVATGQRTFMGTVAYASPEQCRMSATLDGKSDVYSLGVLFYEMLSGDIPFSGSVSEVLGMHISASPRPLRELSPDVPSKVSSLIHEMLAKSPQQRPTMAAVRDRIDQLIADTKKTRAKLPLVIGVSVLAALGTAAALLHMLGRL